MSTASQVTGKGAVAVTPHHAATEAAISVMDSGGSAADAVIAANAVLGMVLPTTCGIGGDLFAIVHEPSWQRPEVLNASGRGGSGLDPQALRAAGHSQIPPLGPEAVSVPGCVDGWEALSDRHGRLGLSVALEPAIAAGETGFEVSLELSDDLTRLAESLVGQPSAKPLYPDDTPPAPGTVLTRSDLAATLEQIATGGRQAFYEGPVASAITTASSGTLTTEDLARNTVDWVEPLGLEVFGHTGWTVPPNSQGYLTLATCWVFEQLGAPSDPAHPAYHHALIEAYRALAWERNDVVADPDHIPWEIGRYLDTDRLRERVEAIDSDRAADWPEPTPGPPGTAYFCAIDERGQAVSCIQSNYFGIGSRVSAGNTGVFLHNRGAGFSLIQDHPNEAQPGKRPLHTLSPTLWTRDRDLAVVLGTRGGDQQPQFLAQMASAALYSGAQPAEAQALPRWNISPAGGEASVVVEPGMPEQVVDGLLTRGHSVVAGPTRTPGWGPVSIVTVTPAGTRTAAADPRVSTATAAAY